MLKIIRAESKAQLDEARELMRAFVAWHHRRHAVEIELVRRYFDSRAFEAELKALPGEYAPPQGRLLLAWKDERALGCVALRSLGSGNCEMKRMYVHEDGRGTGVGRALGAAILHEAAEIGYTRMRLDTGARQVEAQQLYRSLGFNVIPPYYPVSPELASWLVFMERSL